MPDVKRTASEERRQEAQQKDLLEPALARERKRLLQQAMGKELYFKEHRSEINALQKLRREREQSIEVDAVCNPEFGTLKVAEDGTLDMPSSGED